MNTNDDGQSIPIPKRKDLLALSERPYRKPDAAILPKVFAQIAAHGRCSKAELSKECERNFLKDPDALNAAVSREHLAYDRDGSVRLGPKFGTIPIAPTAAESSAATSKKPCRTDLRDYWLQTVRPKFAKRFSRGDVNTSTVVVNAIESWRPNTCVEDVDEKWFKEFTLHMKAKGLSACTCRNRLIHLNRLIREKYPYRFFTERARWSSLEPQLRREAPGHLGNYYTAVYEPTTGQKKNMKWFDRSVVKRFHRWIGRPVRLDELDNSMLERFRRSELSRVATPRTAGVHSATIRRIVNHWDHGRLGTVKSPPTFALEEGSVQQFVEHQYLSTTRCKASTAQYYRRIMRDLFEFRGGRCLAFADFDDELCNRFMRWCMEERASGKLMNLNNVNSNVRSMLVQISIAAKAAGLMRKRIFLDPIGTWKPRKSSSVKASKKGQDETSTNSHTAAAAAPSGPDDGWTEFKTAEHWERVFHVSFSALKKRRTAHLIKFERMPGHWLYRFRREHVPTSPSKPR